MAGYSNELGGCMKGWMTHPCVLCCLYERTIEKHTWIHIDRQKVARHRQTADTLMLYGWLDRWVGG